MKYMGSKASIAKYIVPILQKEIDETNLNYVELFSGGANIIGLIRAENRLAVDKNIYLQELFKHVQTDNELYSEVSKGLYDKARQEYHLINQDKINTKERTFEDWELGNIGFLASYNGRFFDGWYAKTNYNLDKPRDYYQEARRNILKQKELIKDVRFCCADYTEFLDLKNKVIYLDPPYQQTKGYTTSNLFNHEEFWENVRLLSKNNSVFISEQQAPNDFDVLWEKEVKRIINAKNRFVKTEKLFKLKRD